VARQHATMELAMAMQIAECSYEVSFSLGVSPNTSSRCSCCPSNLDANRSHFGFQPWRSSVHAL
jgi:hypothetical protein